MRTNFKIVYWSRFFSGKRTTQIVFVTYKLLEYFKRSSAIMQSCRHVKLKSLFAQLLYDKGLLGGCPTPLNPPPVATLLVRWIHQIHRTI